MLRLIQAKGSPVRRIFRQLAELGVPCSMTEDLTGCKLVDWHDATPKQEAKLQALWALAEAYTDVANREPGAVEGLDAVVVEALQLGVWYEAPSCAAVVIERRANKVRRFVEDIDTPCRPGRSHSAERLWRSVIRAVPDVAQLHPEHERIIELRLLAWSTSAIADDIRKSDVYVRRLLKTRAIREGIERHRPFEEVEAAVARKANEDRSEALRARAERRQQADRERAAAIKAKAEARKAKAAIPKLAPGRPRTKGWDDAWILEQVEKGASVYSLATVLKTTRQALTYRVKQARRAAQTRGAT